MQGEGRSIQPWHDLRSGHLHWEEFPLSPDRPASRRNTKNAPSRGRTRAARTRALCLPTTCDGFSSTASAHLPRRSAHIPAAAEGVSPPRRIAKHPIRAIRFQKGEIADFGHIFAADPMRRPSRRSRSTSRNGNRSPPWPGRKARGTRRNLSRTCGSARPAHASRLPPTPDTMCREGIPTSNCKYSQPSRSTPSAAAFYRAALAKIRR